MRYFNMHGYSWCVRFVPANSSELKDRSNKLRMATTDPSNYTICISANIPQDLLPKVLIHEMTHAVLFSYDLLPDIHRMVKKRYWVEAEEWVCNLMSDYAAKILCEASRVTETDIFEMIPREFERLLT